MWFPEGAPGPLHSRHTKRLGGLLRQPQGSPGTPRGCARTTSSTMVLQSSPSHGSPRLKPCGIESVFLSVGNLFKYKDRGAHVSLSLLAEALLVLLALQAQHPAASRTPPSAAFTVRLSPTRAFPFRGSPSFLSHWIWRGWEPTALPPPSSQYVGRS